MDVSIIIINYNTFALTCQCIKSLLQFNCGFSYEIILVDNASTECDVSLFLRVFPTITFVKSDINLGFAGGNNLGIQQAKGKYILLLNSDTYLIENSILNSIKYMNENTQVGLHTVKLVYQDGRIQSCAQRFPSIKYSLIELFRIQKLLPNKIRGRLLLGSFFNYNETTEVDWVWGAYFFFRKKILQRMPNQLLDSSYFMYFEDMQWSMDIKKLGFQVRFLSNTTIIHLMGGSNGTKNELMLQNGDLFMKKNYSYLYRFILKYINNIIS